jgi:hypothetical protein
MIKDLETLKEFITWAKIHKVKSVKLGDIHVEMSDLAFIESLGLEAPSAPLKTEENQLLTEEKKEDEDLLFFSSN